MLNNKGQSLVLFVVVLPILMLILVLIVDIGKAIVLKQELDNINRIVLDYGLDNIGKENLNEELSDLIKLNNNNINQIDIEFEDNKLHLDISCKLDGMFSSFVDISIFNINSSYVGYIEENEKRIEKVNG